MTVICVVQARLLRLNLANCDMGPGTEDFFSSFFLGGGGVCLILLKLSVH